MNLQLLASVALVLLSTVPGALADSPGAEVLDRIDESVGLGTSCQYSGHSYPFTSNCNRGEMCRLQVGFCARDSNIGRAPQGSCQTMNPTFCAPGLRNQVCACNGKTYQSQCLANHAGWNVRHNGPCNSDKDNRKSTDAVVGVKKAVANDVVDSYDNEEREDSYDADYDLSDEELIVGEAEDEDSEDMEEEDYDADYDLSEDSFVAKCRKGFRRKCRKVRQSSGPKGLKPHFRTVCRCRRNRFDEPAAQDFVATRSYFTDGDGALGDDLSTGLSEDTEELIMGEVEADVEDEDSQYSDDEDSDLFTDLLTFGCGRTCHSKVCNKCKRCISTRCKGARFRKRCMCGCGKNNSCAREDINFLGAYLLDA